MFRKTLELAVVMVVLVAAAQARSRGAKLGHRQSRQNYWGRQRENLYTQSGAAQATGLQQQPSSQAAGYQQPSPQSAGYNQPSSQSVGFQQPSSQAAGYHQQSSVVQNSGYPSASGQDNSQQSATTQIVPGVPPVPNSLCKYSGFFPTPGSCTNFYRCVDFSGAGTYFSVFQFNCPDGTIFDDELDTCNHIAWTVFKRPECADMMKDSLVPTSTVAPESNSTSVSGSTTVASTQTPYVSTAKLSTTTAIPVISTEKPIIPSGGVYPQPGAVSTTARPAFTMECHTDDVYRRHPLYCNRYYQCQWDGQDYVFATQTCPAELVFAQAQQQCVGQDILGCEGEMASPPEPISVEETTTEAATEQPTASSTASTTPSPSTEPSSTEPTGSPTGSPSTEPSSTSPPSTGPSSTEVTSSNTSTTAAPSTTISQNTVDPSSLYDCPAKGYYPFEGDCIRFYKCVTIEANGNLKGLLYKCPEGFGYSEEKKRCDRSERLPPCEKTLSAAHLRMAPARLLSVDDLAWFFSN